ncbi:MAG: hypothetical protein GY861_18040 [bacterium]|nr:hypothetical protein [bacterium]
MNEFDLKLKEKAHEMSKVFRDKKTMVHNPELALKLEEIGRWVRNWCIQSTKNYWSDEYVQQVGSWKINQRLECEIKELRNENTKLREALEIYAARDCFEYVEGKRVTEEAVKLIHGLGRYAREALAETEGEK